MTTPNIYADWISISDESKNWRPDNKWIGAKVKIVEGRGYGQVRRIIKSNHITLWIAEELSDGYVGEPWEIIPGTGYVVEPIGGWTRGYFRRRDMGIDFRQIYENEIFDEELIMYDMWDEWYDGIKVSWNDGVNSGTESYGDCRTGRKILTINNSLIQNQFLAKSLAVYTYGYFSVKRRMIKEFKTVPLPQLEPMDAIQPVIKDIYGMNMRYLIKYITVSLQNGMTKISMIQQ